MNLLTVKGECLGPGDLKKQLGVNVKTEVKRQSLGRLLNEPCVAQWLYSTPNIVRLIKSRRMRWAGHVARMEEGRCVHKVLVGKPEGKRPLGRPSRRWEDNINLLKTKRNLLYIRKQSVARSKHFPPRL